ncbi:MAG TPA: helix-turn-helix domain-containing protein [Solirubrobacteraceae bacterium]|nr:helix-turn-helix domain-containing protein [Solirubrobacteraceae bacterium]
MDVKSRKAEQSAATRDSLVAVARELFAERGYGDVPTEEIVRRAGVTRGALYHHFRDKRDLFHAVVEQVEIELTQRIATESLAGKDPVEALQIGAQAFLDACREPAIQQILLADAPSVLGWSAWRELGSRYGLGVIEAALGAAMDAGLIARQPIKPLSHLLLGGLDEAAMYVATADDAASARAEMGAILDRYLRALAAEV